MPANGRRDLIWRLKVNLVEENTSDCTVSACFILRCENLGCVLCVVLFRAVCVSGVIKMEQEPNYVRDLVEGVTKLPRLRKEAPVCRLRNEVVTRNPLMYSHEKERQAKFGDSL
jgi:hypothetical protein